MTSICITELHQTDDQQEITSSFSSLWLPKIAFHLMCQIERALSTGCRFVKENLTLEPQLIMYSTAVNVIVAFCRAMAMAVFVVIWLGDTGECV